MRRLEICYKLFTEYLQKLVIYMKFFYVDLCFVILFAVSGCETIPPGDAPTGPIVASPVTKKIIGREAAVNWMITSLSSACLQNALVGKNMQKDFNGTSEMARLYPEKVFVKVAAVTGIKSGGEHATLKLQSRMDKGSSNVEWKMELFSGDKSVWSDAVFFK